MTRLFPKPSRKSARLIAKDAMRDPLGVHDFMTPPDVPPWQRAIITACQWLAATAFAATIALIWGAPWELF